MLISSAGAILKADSQFSSLASICSSDTTNKLYFSNSISRVTYAPSTKD